MEFTSHPQSNGAQLSSSSIFALIRSLRLPFGKSSHLSEPLGWVFHPTADGYSTCSSMKLATVSCWPTTFADTPLFERSLQ